MRIPLWILFITTLVAGVSSQEDNVPRPIGLLQDYQLSFTKQKIEAQLANFKSRINGPPGSFKPWRSPAKVLRDSEAQHRVNHAVEAFEWFLSYAGSDITPAILLFFAICPIFFGHFIATYVYRILKPTLLIKRKSNFPIMPLKYLQETKEEQRVFLPSKNTLQWVSTRYIIMASDNVVNLKMLHYSEDSEEKRQIKYRKHRAWFMLRILTQYNALYTRNRLDRGLVGSMVKEEHEGQEEKVNPKMAQLVKIRRLQEHEARLKLRAEREAERRQKEAERNAPPEEKEFYRYDLDKSGRRMYTYEHRHPKERASIVQDGQRVRLPGSVKRRTSLEVMYEGVRRAMLTPYADVSPERLRKMSSDSLQGEPAPFPPPKEHHHHEELKPKEEVKRRKREHHHGRHAYHINPEKIIEASRTLKPRSKVYPTPQPRSRVTWGNAGKPKKDQRRSLVTTAGRGSGESPENRKRSRGSKSPAAGKKRVTQQHEHHAYHLSPEHRRRHTSRRTR